jgi:hypothetical protein
MHRFLTFIIIFITSAVIYGQNYVTIYKKDLPTAILQYYSSDAINDIIKRDASLNPELIYWRINYLNEVVLKKITDPQKNGYNYLTKLVNDSYKVRKEFFNRQYLINIMTGNIL